MPSHTTTTPKVVEELTGGKGKGIDARIGFAIALYFVLHGVQAALIHHVMKSPIQRILPQFNATFTKYRNQGYFQGNNEYTVEGWRIALAETVGSVSEQVLYAVPVMLVILIANGLQVLNGRDFFLYLVLAMCAYQAIMCVRIGYYALMFN
jgi:hypothetical protein